MFRAASATRRAVSLWALGGERKGFFPVLPLFANSKPLGDWVVWETAQAHAPHDARDEKDTVAL